ncbi:glycoside hydrolase family 15 protein [Schlegelella sp. S2-27]|uniref:Glycoside hydrolase family 15 protein n=1 Tax=Caldimonas mangrovi TaxID=2944811 RepID=A0ABT0YR95_9BURK|nr:glycoside hydrolase family 15 protein [Caldimonas mangrovi]MCM5681250.1 glycoside hydrolase family 15 protein [Caldimonas mangrovi]
MDSSRLSGRYRPIADYALIGDGHCTALVARDGSIDWCCMPAMDADSCFGRLLDARLGGHCQISVEGQDVPPQRRYEPDTMVLTTRFSAPGGQAELHDFFPMLEASGRRETGRLARVVRCTSGQVDVRIEIVPRFDFGEIIPDMRERRPGLYTACGSNKGLLIQCDSNRLRLTDARDALTGSVRLREGEKLRLSIRFVAPEQLEQAADVAGDECGPLDDELRRTMQSWRTWASSMLAPFAQDPLTSRSALVLKALTYEPTGAMVAAATTSLPESPGGARNWDYRYSWVRDSVLAVRALHAVGIEREANRFRSFIERSAAGSAQQLQVMYGVDGKRRLTEVVLDWLEGYEGSRPVRIGNRAAQQMQLDVYGTLLELAWIWHDESRPLDPCYWRFLADAVDAVCLRWHEPDHGIWEFRDRSRHFVHSKAMCWVALERGCQLAREHGFDAPLAHWRDNRDAVRTEIEQRGYDARRGVFVQAFDEPHLDAAALLLPPFGFIAYDDPRMLRTVQALIDELEHDGLLLRYRSPDGFASPEGVFLPCTFWLVRCLAHQGRVEDAWRYYRRATSCANDLGLFSEEYDAVQHRMLGNFPQVLTHVSQMTALRALVRAAGDAQGDGKLRNAGGKPAGTATSSAPAGPPAPPRPGETTAA